MVNQEQKLNRKELIKVTAIAVLLSCIAIKPFSDATKWSWRALNLFTFDKSSLETNFNISPQDKDFKAPFKTGDKVLQWEITSAFGNREEPLSGASTFHEGVDIGTPTGTPVYAIGKTNGKNDFSQGYVDVACPWRIDNPPEGLAAYITTPLLPEYEIALFHLNECYAGRHPIGSMIAKSGNTGMSSGEHLHFGVKLKGQWIDPPRGFIISALQGKWYEPNKSKPIVERLRNAIISQESGHDPKAVNPDSSALGLGQVMPENIKSWSKQCLGQEITEDEFLHSKDKQLNIIDCKLKEGLEQTAKSAANEEEQIRQVAAIWYSGDPKLFDDGKPQTYGAGSYPSVRDYTMTVLDRYKKQ